MSSPAQIFGSNSSEKGNVNRGFPDLKEDDKAHTSSSTCSLTSNTLSNDFKSSYCYLHLQSCDEETFLTRSPSGDGTYEVIDGILSVCPMSTRYHDAVILMLQGLFIGWKIRFCSISTSSHDCPLQLFAVRDAAVWLNKRNILRPNISIGVPVIHGKAAFPEGKPPKVVIEITSMARKMNLKVNAPKYAGAGIETYIIIDHRSTCLSSTDGGPKVHVGILRQGAYTFKEYGLTEIVDIPYIGSTAVSELMKPQKTLPDFALVAIQKDGEKLEKEVKRLPSALDLKFLTERVNKLLRKNEKNKREKHRLRQKLLDLGREISSSSDSL